MTISTDPHDSNTYCKDRIRYNIFSTSACPSSPDSAHFAGTFHEMCNQSGCCNIEKYRRMGKALCKERSENCRRKVSRFVICCCHHFLIFLHLIGRQTYVDGVRVQSEYYDVRKRKLIPALLASYCSLFSCLVVYAQNNGS